MAILKYIFFALSLLSCFVVIADDKDALIDEALYLVNAEEKWTSVVTGWFVNNFLPYGDLYLPHIEEFRATTLSWDYNKASIREEIGQKYTVEELTQVVRGLSLPHSETAPGYTAALTHIVVTSSSAAVHHVQELLIERGIVTRQADKPSRSAAEQDRINRHLEKERKNLSPATCQERAIEIPLIIFPRHAPRSLYFEQCEVTVYFSVYEKGAVAFKWMELPEGGRDWRSIAKIVPEKCEYFIHTVVRAIKNSRFKESNSPTDCSYRHQFILEP